MDRRIVQPSIGSCGLNLGPGLPQRWQLWQKGRRRQFIVRADPSQPLNDGNKAKEVLEYVQCELTEATKSQKLSSPEWLRDFKESLQNRLPQTGLSLPSIDVPQWMKDAEKQAARLEQGLQNQLDSVIGTPASGSGGTGPEPHFGTRAVQKSLDSIAGRIQPGQKVQGALDAAKAAGVSAGQRVEGIWKGPDAKPGQGPQDASAGKPSDKPLPGPDTGSSPGEGPTDLPATGSEKTQGITDLSGGGSKQTQGITDLSGGGSKQSQGITDLSGGGPKQPQGSTDLSGGGSKQTQGITDLSGGGSKQTQGITDLSGGGPKQPQGSTDLSGGGSKQTQGITDLSGGGSKQTQGITDLSKSKQGITDLGSKQSQGPPAGSKVPHGPTDAPAAGPKAPQGSGSKLSQGSTEAPSGGSKLPHSPTDAPAGGSQLAHSPTDAPGAGAKLPQGSTNAPAAGPSKAPAPPEVPSTGAKPPAPTEVPSAGPKPPAPTEMPSTAPKPPAPTEVPSTGPKPPVPTEMPSTGPSPPPAPTELPATVTDSVTSAPDAGSNVPHGPSELATTVADAISRLETFLAGPGFAGYSWPTLAGITLAVGVVIAFSIPRDSQFEDDEPLPPLVYDVDDVTDYWTQRPVAVAKRAAVVAFEGLRWAIGLGFDNLRGVVKENAADRASDLRQVLERLGPAYVKVAQAVSTRVDLLEPEYLQEIELLQDRVPPFPNHLAFDTIEAAFGRPSNSIFERLSRAPVAAASLGQVYRGRLWPEFGGGEVAVKVQRPGVLLSVALDLFLMRWTAVAVDRLFKTHWTGIIDEWAGRFFHEMDYSREANNAIIFKEQMADLEGITVPDVYPQLCTQQVLTTAWVQGEKLSESNASDVRELCNTLLNCYLIQLMETGFLHADPHPGNLLRTPDGKICILDFGLMTEISPDRSMALVEYIAHLTTEDYNAIPGDLYKLGFIPPGSPDPMTSGLVGPLSSILKQLSHGGGAKSINIDEVIMEMEELTRRYPFQIPSYFALILRAFSVIEGIALRVDPSYAIVQECFPYLAKRLFTDNSPRVRVALQQMLYGDNKRLDIDRLQRLANGFGNFTVDGLKIEAYQPGEERPILDETAKEALRTLFRPGGSILQDVFVAESVAAADAIGRELISQVSRGVLGSVPAMATLSFVEALGPLRPFLLPVMTPPEILSRVAPSVAPTEEDRQALMTARSLLSIVQPQQGPRALSDPSGIRRAVQLARELQPLLPEILPGATITGELFVRSLTQRVALRISEEAGKPPRGRAAPRRVPRQPEPQQSTWWAEAIAASPLWLLLPPPPGLPQARFSLRDPDERER